jgi:hypothetical protein
MSRTQAFTPLICLALLVLAAPAFAPVTQPAADQPCSRTVQRVSLRSAAGVIASSAPQATGSASHALSHALTRVTPACRDCQVAFRRPSPAVLQPMASRVQSLANAVVPLAGPQCSPPALSLSS